MAKVKERAPLLITAALLATGIVLLFAYGEQLSRYRNDLQELGPLGIVLFVVAYVIWTLTALPTQPLMTFAGLVYGSVRGSMYVLVSSLLGITVAFWLGRYFCQERVRGWASRHRRAGKMLQFADDHPISIVLIARLVPVFPFMNYAIGTTRIAFRKYFLVSALVLVPGAALYAGVGDIAMRKIEGRLSLSADWVAWLAASVVLSAIVGYFARRAYREANRSDERER